MPEEVFRGVKFNRKITWDKDVMKVTDSVSDVYNDAVKKMSDDLNDKTEAEVLRHFEIDMSELWEFLRYKEAGITIPRWIPVTERTPEGRPYVLCCGSKGGMFVGWVGDYRDRDKGKVTAFLHGGQGRKITHWMPLPLPPKTDKQEGEK